MTRVISPPVIGVSAVSVDGFRAEAAVFRIILLLRTFSMLPSSANAMVSEGTTQNGRVFSLIPPATKNASIVHIRQDTAISE